jgi:hypothetical protein
MGFLQRTIATTLVLAGLASTAASADARTPVLLELFTSEGCSSCPPADELLQNLDRTQPVAGAELIVLSEHVDYWNNLGWKDPFSSAQFTQRQYDYADKLDGRDGAYTPELVIDGRTGVVGSDTNAVKAAITSALAMKKTTLDILDASRHTGSVTLRVATPALQNGNAHLYVAIAMDHATTHVLRGENEGRTLSHVAVVRNLTDAGKLSPGNAATRDLTVPLIEDGAASGLRVVVFVQDGRSGAVLGIASRRLDG